MKKLSTLAFFICTLSVTWAQQELGLTFLPSLVQSQTQVNPAIISSNKVSIALPGVYAGYRNSSFRIGDLFTDTNAGRSLDLDEILSNMPDNGNVIRQAVNFNSGAISVRFKEKFQLSWFHNQQVDLQVQFPKALPELLWKGNSAFIGQEVEIGPKLDLLGYSEYGFGFAGKLNKKLTLGFNLKYLSGFMGVRTIRSGLSVYTDEEYYQLRLESDMLFQTGGLNDVFNSSQDDALPRQDLIYFINSRNTGFAGDVGFTYQLSDAVQIHGAVQDIGNINWKQYALEQKSQGTFEYDGQVVNPFDGDDEFNFDEVADSLGQLFDFTATRKAFVTNLPRRFYLGSTYGFRPGLQFGATVQGEFYHYASNLSFSFHAQKQVGSFLSVGTLIGYHNRAGLMAGFNSAVELGPVQLFFITDNIITLVNPDAGRNTNVRAGINLKLFKEKKEEPVLLPLSEDTYEEIGTTNF